MGYNRRLLGLDRKDLFVVSRLKARLSAMMFLEYFVPGCTVPILSHYLRNSLHFEAYQVGQVMGVMALAAFFAPFVASHVADRYMRGERMLGLCHGLSAVAMLGLASQGSFWPFLGLYFVYGLAFTPTFGLTNAVALHNVADARRDFGGLRMWGTAGWVVVGWLSFVWLRGGGDVRRMLYVSAATSLVLAAYSMLALPRSEMPARRERTTVMYWKALKVLVQPGLLLLCVLTFASGMTHQVYYLGMSPYLSQLGFRNEYIMPIMSVGQVSEVVVLGLLGICLGRISVKQAMVVGLAAQAVRYALFAFGQTAAPILAGISLHGICYAFYFTAAYIYVDQHSTAETRAGAQQLFTIIISGFGTAGAYVAGGYFQQLLTSPETGLVDYKVFWSVPAGVSLCIAIIMLVFFRETAPATERAPEVAEAAG